MGKISQALEKSEKPIDRSPKPRPIRRPPVVTTPAAAKEKAAAPRPVTHRSPESTPSTTEPPTRINEADLEAQGFTEIPSNPSRPATETTQAPGVDPIEIDPKLVIYTNPHSYEAEQFRKLRNTILFPPSGRPPQSILITSALPGEGKSFVSANLAASIAQHLDKHVLLVDGDVRRPTLHTYFGLSHTEGLTEVLQGKISIPNSLVKTPIDRLTLLPAGHTPKNPSELLSSRKMGDLLKEITSRYSDRMVLIDSPPPQMTSETSAMARQVDGILLVVRFLKSNREMTSELVAMLDRERILGVVGNHLDIKTLSYYGKSKYTNYGHYYGR